MRVENLLRQSPGQKAEFNPNAGRIRFSLRRRTGAARKYTAQMVRKIWIYVIIGIGTGAWIHGYAPADLLTRYAGDDQWYAVPFATLVGTPLYSNAAGIMPIVNSLFEKGAELGTALAFIMATIELSLPEFPILKNAMEAKLILLFAAIVGTGIILTGYLFNSIPL